MFENMDSLVAILCNSPPWLNILAVHHCLTCGACRCLEELWRQMLHCLQRSVQAKEGNRLSDSVRCYQVKASAVVCERQALRDMLGEVGVLFIGER